MLTILPFISCFVIQHSVRDIASIYALHYLVERSVSQILESVPQLARTNVKKTGETKIVVKANT